MLLAGSATSWAQGETNDILSHTLKASTADAAWAELQASVKPPAAPASWDVTPPTQAERQKFFLPFIQALADRTEFFAKKFPSDPHALGARISEVDFYNLAFSLGSTNGLARARALEEQLLHDPSLNEADRFHIRQAQVERAASSAGDSDSEAAIAALYKGARQLQKEFPRENQVLQMLLSIAPRLDPAEAKAVFQEVAADTNAPPQFQKYAADQLKTASRVGQPLALQFTAVDGRPVNLAQMKGNVVLVDFWATWCPPCVRSLPEVKATYDKLHSKGLDIVGVSLDEDKSALTSFVSAHQMAWPQYFDGLHWKNKIAQEFAIESIPTMWLVDKKGVLRDTNARENLAGKIEKLLAE